VRGAAGSPTRRLTLAALAVFGLMGIPALASLALVEIRQFRHEELGEAVDLAGRRPMLAERIAGLAEPLVHSRDDAVRALLRRRILEAADLLERSHDALARWDEPQELRRALPTGGPRVEAPQELDAAVRAYVDAARRLATLPAPALGSDAAPLRAIQELRVPLANDLERVLEEHAARQASAATRLHRLVVGLSLAVLAGLALAWYGLFRPMLRHMRREHEALDESESRLRALVERLPVAEWDATGRILYASPRTLELSGIEPAVFVGRHWTEFGDPGRPQGQERIREAFLQALESGRSAEAPYRFRHADGTWRYHELALHPFRTAAGELRMVSVSRDVTDRRELEMLRRLTRQLEETSAELQRANAELDEFASVAAHDLQEPLRKLVSFGQLLREDLGGELPEAAATDLEFIVSATRRMQHLVRNLLRLSRASAADLKRERLPADRCVDRALESLELRIRETGARVTRDALPEVMADPTLLHAIYQNLISNALKFHGAAPPALHLSVERRSEGWILGVRDHGIGVPAEHVEEIFKPFRRLQEASAGTGIGLAICLKAVRRHGGWIRVESPPDGGAHFRFWLGSASEVGERRG